MSLISDGTRFIIDSSKCVPGGTDGDFQYIINMPKDKDYNRVCLLQAEIPKSYWLVNAPNNIFILNENGVITPITLPEGNYNVISWITIIANLMTTMSTQVWVYSILFADPTVQVETGMFTYVAKGGFGAQPIISFPVGSLLYEQFGFTINSSNQFVGGFLTSTTVVKFQVEDILFLHSDLSYNNDQSSDTDVLQEIYSASTPPFTNITYQNTNIEAYSSTLRSTNKNVYKFCWTDESGNKINFRGKNNCFTLIAYRKNNIDQLIAQNLLLNNKREIH